MEPHLSARLLDMQDSYSQEEQNSLSDLHFLIASAETNSDDDDASICAHLVRLRENDVHFFPLFKNTQHHHPIKRCAE